MNFFELDRDLRGEKWGFWAEKLHSHSGNRPERGKLERGGERGGGDFFLICAWLLFPALLVVAKAKKVDQGRGRRNHIDSKAALIGIKVIPSALPGGSWLNNDALWDVKGQVSKTQKGRIWPQV